MMTTTKRHHNESLHKLTSMSTCCLACFERDTTSLLDANISLASVGGCLLVWTYDKVEQVHETMTLSTWDGQRCRILRIDGDMSGDCNFIALVDMDKRARVVWVDAHMESDSIPLLVTSGIVWIGAVVGKTCTMWHTVY